jgi:16S rRNA (adenine1518-N6/adenine1519-N6)-dimethyltransferase
MVQKEVAERLLAKPKTKAYSQLSIKSQYLSDVKKVTDVPRKNFRPIPNVDSAVIKITPHDFAIRLDNYKVFDMLLQKSFQKRRKILKNSLKEILETYRIDNIISIDLRSRPEELSVGEFVELSNEISAHHVI